MQTYEIDNKTEPGRENWKIKNSEGEWEKISEKDKYTNENITLA